MASTDPDLLNTETILAAGSSAAEPPAAGPVVVKLRLGQGFESDFELKFNLCYQWNQIKVSVEFIITFAKFENSIIA